MSEIASAFVTIAPSAKGFGSSLNKQVAGPLRSSGTSMGKTFGKLFAASAGLLAAAGLTNLISGSIDEAREAQKVGAQTNAVIKSTGGVANVTAGQVSNLAAALSAKIGVDDEAIQAGQNMLLTFTNVRNEVGKGNDIFNRATTTVQDMAAAFGGDSVSNSKILGKALNDPIKGVTALGRAGVQFSEKQKDTIKTMVESGNVMGAQKLILGELAKQTKGSAEAQATAGDKAKVALGNLKETIGTALLPVIDKLATVFTDKIAPAIQTFIGQLQSGEGAGGRVAAIFGTLASVLGTLFTFINNNRTVTAVFVGGIVAMTVATAAFNAVLAANPISLIIIGLAALAAGLVYAYKHSETFRAVVDTAFNAIKKVISAVIGFVVPFVKSHWKLLVAIIGGPVAAIAILVATHFGTVKKVVGAVADFVVSSAKKYIEFQRKVADVVGKVIKFFKEMPGKVKGFLSKLPGQLVTIGGQIVDGLKRGIEGAAHKVMDAVQAIIDKIPKKIRQIMGIASPSKVTKQLGGYIGDGLAEGILGKKGAVEDSVGKVADGAAKKLKERVDKIRDALAQSRSDFASLVEPISSAFTGNLFEADTASGFLSGLMGTKGTLSGLLDAFKTLTKAGLKPGFLYQLFQSGNAGLILDLAANPALAVQAGAAFGDVTSLSDQLGNSVAGATDKGAALENQTARLEKKLDKLTKHVDESANRFALAVNGAASNGRRRAA